MVLGTCGNFQVREYRIVVFRDFRLVGELIDIPAIAMTFRGAFRTLEHPKVSDDFLGTTFESRQQPEKGSLELSVLGTLRANREG